MNTSKFKIGDKVSVIDDNLNGIITTIQKETITIKTNDGFLLNFNTSEIVIIPENQASIYKVTKDNLNEFSQKSFIKTKKNNLLKKKNKQKVVIEIDLHIEQLVNTIKGLNNYDMLNIQIEAAKRKLEFAIEKNIQHVIFIHGIGEGVLKKELEYLFQKYDVNFYAASFQKYGMGATEVYIYQNKKNTDFEIIK